MWVVCVDCGCRCGGRFSLLGKWGRGVVGVGKTGVVGGRTGVFEGGLCFLEGVENWCVWD